MDYDNSYIETWSLWMDVKILFRTAFVIFQKGSY
ncbi:MAG: sugar transferase [Mangrovicoccus sp.]